MMTSLCSCIEFNREHYLHELAENKPIANSVSGGLSQLVATRPCYLSASQLMCMRRSITALESVCSHETYKQKVLADGPEIARINFGTSGVMMGYDFHISDGTPKLIEINTNAGGALINHSIAGAHKHCCLAAKIACPHVVENKREILKSFLSEWRSQRESATPRCIAIVDTQPEKQFLHPEFLMFQRLFEQAGIETIIVAPSKLEYRGQQLVYRQTPIDMVYNRITDFYFEDPESAALAEAYTTGNVVVTPSPHHHAIYANKRNLTLLSDPRTLGMLGIPESTIKAVSETVPSTIAVTTENAAKLWKARRQWVFKPAGLYGSKAVYRGEKLTKKTWEYIQQGGYVAQLYVPAPTLCNGSEAPMKYDIRNFTYRGKVQIVGARLYRGQVTNMRTEGGGFAPVVKSTLNLRCRACHCCA